MRRAWGLVVLAACGAAGCGGGAAKPAAKPAVIKQLAQDLDEIAVFSDKDLTNRDFSIPTTESVELLVAESVTDPETGQPVTVYKIRWRDRTGYVPQDAIKR